MFNNYYNNSTCILSKICLYTLTLHMYNPSNTWIAWEIHKNEKISMRGVTVVQTACAKLCLHKPSVQSWRHRHFPAAVHRRRCTSSTCHACCFYQNSTPWWSCEQIQLWVAGKMLEMTNFGSTYTILAVLKILEMMIILSYHYDFLHKRCCYTCSYAYRTIDNSSAHVSWSG